MVSTRSFNSVIESVLKHELTCHHWSFVISTFVSVECERNSHYIFYNYLLSLPHQHHLMPALRVQPNISRHPIRHPSKRPNPVAPTLIALPVHKQRVEGKERRTFVLKVRA